MSLPFLHALPLLLWGCGPTASESEASRSLTILAASSLTEVFPALASVFESQHPEVEITLSFAGSQTLATHVRHGLEADVFASANSSHVQALAEEALALDPEPFATNTLVLALAPGYTGAVDLEQLPRVGSLIVGAPEVPVGSYTLALFEAAQRRFGNEWRAEVEARIVSREPSVRLVTAKVALGEADAAIVYASDVANQTLRHVLLPPELAPRATYFQVQLSGGPSPALAGAWMAFLKAEGQAILVSHGFSEATEE
jgi:molybdate transport system substrate-binding protein